MLDDVAVPQCRYEQLALFPASSTGPLRYVPCRLRGSHLRLADCWLCWCDAHREAEEHHEGPPQAVASPDDHGCAGQCSSYRPGHRLHWIPANRAGQSPWGWRDATVTHLDGRRLTAHYLSEDVTLHLWHHEPLDAVATVGSPVRVHEQYKVLGGPFGWVSVAIADGLGPVPTPEDPSVWAAETTIAVTDLAEGRALPMDHVAIDDPADVGYDERGGDRR